MCLCVYGRVCVSVCVCLCVYGHVCECVQCACAQTNMQSFTTAHNVCIQAFVACVLACKCKATGSALTHRGSFMCMLQASELPMVNTLRLM